MELGGEAETLAVSGFRSVHDGLGGWLREVLCMNNLPTNRNQQGLGCNKSKTFLPKKNFLEPKKHQNKKSKMKIETNSKTTLAVAEPGRNVSMQWRLRTVDDSGRMAP